MDVLMPQLGETVAEGKIVKWFKQAGDAVKPGENLFEIETDKTSMEVPAIAAGTLSDIRFQVGEVAKVGAVVAVIAGAGGAAQAASVEIAKVSPQPPLTPAKAGVQTEARLDSRLRGNERSGRQVTRQASTGARHFAYPDMSPWREVRTPERNHGPAKVGGRHVTPLARRLASEQGIDLGRVAGSGPHGRIVAADIAAAPRAAAPASAASQFHVVADIEIGRLLAMRDEAKAAGVEFTIGDFAVKAWSAAQRRVAPDAGADIALVHLVDGKRVTKVIRDAAGKSLSTIAREAAGGSGSGAPGAGASSAVHVLATPGIREFSAVVTPPFTSVLSIGQPRRAPVEAEDGGVRFVSQMTATLSCDARAYDYIKAAELLAIFKGLVENPVTALI